MGTRADFYRRPAGEAGLPLARHWPPSGKREKRLASLSNECSIRPEVTAAAHDPLSFRELRAANVIRCEQSYFPVGHWSPTDWGCAVAGEVGEMCNLLKKLLRGDDVPIESIAKEIADAHIYLDLLAARLAIDTGAAIRSKFNEVSERKGSSVRL